MSAVTTRRRAAWLLAIAILLRAAGAPRGGLSSVPFRTGSRLEVESKVWIPVKLAL